MGYFAKVNGVGDIELISETLPISVGHKVWWDTNENGVFDPNETPLRELRMELFQGNELVGSTHTDSEGNYWFDFQNVKGGLQPFTDYEIRLATNQGNYKNLELVSGKSSITQTSNEVRYPFRTEQPGANTDALSLGFRCQASHTITTQAVLTQGQSAILLSGYQLTDRFTWLLAGENNPSLVRSIPHSGVVWSGPTPDEPISYQMKVYDARGCVTERQGLISKSLIPDKTSEEVLVVFPNPMKKEATVRLKTPDVESAVLKVVDASGKVLLEQPMQSKKESFEATFRGDALGSGLFIIRVQTAQGVFSKGVIKE